VIRRGHEQRAREPIQAAQHLHPLLDRPAMRLADLHETQHGPSQVLRKAQFLARPAGVDSVVELEIDPIGRDHQPVGRHALIEQHLAQHVGDDADAVGALEDPALHAPRHARHRQTARARQLDPDDVQGGTFTITNPGVFGSLFGTPIINQPQVAILGVGAIEKRPVVIDDAIAIRPMCYLSLSFDHRLIDGAVAASPRRFQARRVLDGYGELAAR